MTDPVDRIIADLFTNGDGERAARLRLESPNGRDLGGWCESAVAEVLRRDMPSLSDQAINTTLARVLEVAASMKAKEAALLQRALSVLRGIAERNLAPDVEEQMESILAAARDPGIDVQGTAAGSGSGRGTATAEAEGILPMSNDLDTLARELAEAMGLGCISPVSTIYLDHYGNPQPMELCTRDLGSAGFVLEEMQRRGFLWRSWNLLELGSVRWFATFWSGRPGCECSAATLPEAICRAALAALRATK